MADEKVQAVNDALDAAVDAMVDSGQYDRTTAEALVFGARPAYNRQTGNLADLDRMGMIATEGRIRGAVGEEDEVTSDISAAFKKPPSPMTAEEQDAALGVSPATANRGGQAAADVGDGGAGADAAATADAGASEASMTMTKAELLEMANSRGVQADDSMTKDEIVAAINA